MATVNTTFIMSASRLVNRRLFLGNAHNPFLSSSLRSISTKPHPQTTYLHRSSQSVSSHDCNLVRNQKQCQYITIRQMAGHNKWSKIRHKKAANDKARAAAHSKAARAIEAASRACNGDMDDLSLQSAISAARAVQLSRERMDRAVERGANPQLRSEGQLVIRRYDGMIPSASGGKVAVIIETLTDNKNRTAANVRNLVTTKNSGELLPTGSNDWLFEHVGLVWVPKGQDGESRDSNGNTNETAQSSDAEQLDMDALLECALEGGASDVDFGTEAEGDAVDTDDSESDAVVIKCEPPDLLNLVKALKAGGFRPAQFENQWLVKEEGNKLTLDAESSDKFERFLNALDEDLDVTNVFHNAILEGSS